MMVETVIDHFFQKEDELLKGYELAKDAEAKQKCIASAKKYRRIALWLTDYQRLKSLEAHTDSYETQCHCFSYHEMLGVYSVRMMDDHCRLIMTYSLKYPLSHEEFVKFCDAQEGGLL